MANNPFKSKRYTFSSIDKIALDPEKGAFNDIGWWAKLYLDIEPFPWQQYFYHYGTQLNPATGQFEVTCKDKLVTAGIRVGKSKGISLCFAHYGMYHPAARLLNTSISSEQAKIVYHNMMEIFSHPHLKHWVEHVEKSPYPLIRLVNGTEYWFRSVGYEADLIRGFEFDWINIDEAAYISSKNTVDTLKGRLLGINPTTRLPRAGIFTMLTSPKGKTGWLYERWRLGDPRFSGANPSRYLSLRVRTTENPLLDQKILQEIMEGYTDRMIQQELLGEFLDDSSAEFALEDIMFCCSEDHGEVRALNEEIGLWRNKQGNKKSARALLGFEAQTSATLDIDLYELEPKAGRQYLASWDLGKKATKAGRNATVGMVWDITELPWKMVAYRYETGSSYLGAMGWIEQWHLKYSSRGTSCYTVIDASGKGDVLNEVIEAENRIQVDGIVYSNQLKPNLITSGKLAIERSLVRFPMLRRMVDQLSIYTQVDKDLPQDIVMAFCQAMHKARELTGVASPGDSGGISTIYRRQGVGMSSFTSRYAERRRASIHIRSGRAG